MDYNIIRPEAVGCAPSWQARCRRGDTANLRTKILDFGGFVSSIVSILRGGILMSTGDFPESLSQAILVGVMLVGRLGVHARGDRDQDQGRKRLTPQVLLVRRRIRLA